MSGQEASSSKSQAGDPEILMYSTFRCGYCRRARQLLEQKGAPYREIRVDEEPAQRETMRQRSGGRRTVPQIFIGERHIGGYDDMAALDRAGKLDPLLAPYLKAG